VLQPTKHELNCRVYCRVEIVHTVHRAGLLILRGCVAELRKGVVAKRDRNNCPLEGKTALLGKKLICPTTLVPYYECCGKRT
jgi:hypothetical protein